VTMIVVVTVTVTVMLTVTVTVKSRSPFRRGSFRHQIRPGRLRRICRLLDLLHYNNFLLRLLIYDPKRDRTLHIWETT